MDDIKVTKIGAYLRVSQELLDSITGREPENPPTIYVEVARSAEWIAEREAFAERWEAIQAEGFRRGWLENSYDEISVTTDTSEWVERPNPNYVPDGDRAA